MARAATVLEVPAAALTSALRTSPRSLTRCSRHGLPAEVHLDVTILAPARRRRLRPLSVLLWFRHVENALEILSGKRARTPVTGWPLCARCRRRSRWARILARALFVTGLVGLLGGLGAGLVLRLSTGEFAPAWLMAAVLLGSVLMPLAGVSVTVGRADRIARARTTRDGALVRFTDPHQEFADRLRALLGDQVLRPHPPGQPGSG